MIILDSSESDKIRKLYIEKFVDTNSRYYVDKIEKRMEFSDGLCYVGYLWDCFRSPQIVTEIETLEILNGKKNIFIMCDIHSCDRIFIPNYWKFPKESVLVSDEWSPGLSKKLPEDIYIFDASFSWSVVYTHETNADEKRYCIFLERSQTQKMLISSDK